MDDPFQFNTNNALSPSQVFLNRHDCLSNSGIFSRNTMRMENHTCGQ